MTFTTINVGQTANDTTGDALRTAFIKLNNAVGSLDSQAYFNTRLVQSNIFLDNTFRYFNANLSGNISANAGYISADSLIVTNFKPVRLTVGSQDDPNPQEEGNVYVGNIILRPNAKYYGTFAGTVSTGSFVDVSITGTTESDDLTTGALRVAGGIESNANVNVGGNLKVFGNSYVSNVAVSGQVTGDVRLYGGTVYINDDPVLTANSTFSGGNIANPTRVTSRVASTRANTGAFVVDGGAGVVGNLFVGANLVVTNQASARYAAFTTNVVVGTHSNVVAWSNGAIRATLTTSSQPNITTIGALTQLNMAGNVSAGAANAYYIGEASTPFAEVYAYRLTGTQITGEIQTAIQTNITTVGNLFALEVAGNATVGNVAGRKGTFSNIAGNLITAAQPNITSVGTLTNLAVTGNVTAGANVTAANLIATTSIRTGTGANIIMAPNTYIGVSATAGVRVPVGTDADRPAAGTANIGMIRLNTTSGMFEGYTGTEWVGFAVGVGAVGGGEDKVFYENDTTVTESYTLTTGRSAMSVGPITLEAGVVVTIPAGKRWVIL
jgi:hypothetical protein